MNEVERRLVGQALERTGGVRTSAAKLLGITLRSLRYRLQKHGVDDGGDDGPTSASMEVAETATKSRPPR